MTSTVSELTNVCTSQMDQFSSFLARIGVQGKVYACENYPPLLLL